jgi:hypothetical protein
MNYNRILFLTVGVVAGIWLSTMWGVLNKPPQAAEASTPAATDRAANQPASTQPTTGLPGSTPSPAEPQAPLTPMVQPNGDVLLFDFEDPSEVGRFVYGNVNTFVEPADNPVRTGHGSCAATYYVGAVRQDKRPIFYTLMHPARGRLSDWSPYTEFTAAIYNNEAFTVTLDVEYADGTASVWRRYNLPPQIWSRLRQPLASLAEDGLNLSTVKRISWSQLDTEMVDINTLYFDDVRLVGADPARSQAAVQAAWAAYEQWEETEGGGIRAPFIPIIHRDETRINEIEQRFGCGDISGYVETDVCIAGGGMAGSSAAIAAGRMRADTLLIEQYGFLGGSATAALVEPFAENRVGNQDLVQGVFQDIVEALIARGGARRDTNRPGVIYFDDELLKFVLNEMVTNSGAKLMLQTWAERPLVKDNVCEGIIVDNKSGRLAILAKVVIDTTGDGDIAAAAGCPFELGRGYDQYTQSTTLFFRMGGVNESAAFAAQAARTDRPGGTIPEDYMFADIFHREVAAGRFPADIPISQLYFEHTTQTGVVSINATRAFEIDATNVGDLTYASVETLRQAIEMSKFLVRNIPGFQNAYLQQTAVQVGIRESRRITGEYQLTGRDVLHAVKFDDAIARGAYGIDIHSPDFTGGGVVGLSLPRGESYDIPYRCLVPLEIENLLLAGRCISVSHVALGSTRIMAIVSGTGQAAGVAAALCVRRDVTPRELLYPELRQALLDQGANLD